MYNVLFFFSMVKSEYLFSPSFKKPYFFNFMFNETVRIKINSKK